MKARHLRPAEPQLDFATLLLMENDGTEIATYTCGRSWRRIERYGRQWRLAGTDRNTGELIYLPETT